MRKKTQTKRMNFRVDEITDRIIRKKAEQAGMSLSALVIGSAVGTKIVSFQEIKNLIGEVKRIGNNVNQLVVLARLGKVQTVNLTGVQEELQAIHEKLGTALKGR